MRYFVGTELGVANLLQRNFDWLHNSLWYEEIPNAKDPRRVMFFLGGQDAIVDAAVSVKVCSTRDGLDQHLFFQSARQKVSRVSRRSKEPLVRS